MQANAETINFEADALARENVPAISRPFDHRDVGSTAVNEGPWTVEQHPYEGPALEASSNANSAAMSMSALKKLCASSKPGGIFEQPEVLDSTMYNPGKNSQSISIRLGFEAVDAACNGHFGRQVSVLPELVRHGRIIKENPTWMPLLGGQHGNDSATPSLLDFNSVNQADRFWQSGDKGQLKIRIAERSAVTKKIIKTVTKIKPIEVK